MLTGYVHILQRFLLIYARAHARAELGKRAFRYCTLRLKCFKIKYMISLNAFKSED